jgi:hypothetical protein
MRALWAHITYTHDICAPLQLSLFQDELFPKAFLLPPSMKVSQAVWLFLVYPMMSRNNSGG